MNKLLLFAFLCTSICACGPICDLPQAYLSIKLIDKANHLPLITNGLYGNDTIKFYEVYYSDPSKPVPISATEFLDASKVNELSILVRGDEERTLYLQLSSADTDTIRFSCPQNNKTCINCTGYYNKEKICEHCEKVGDINVSK